MTVAGKTPVEMFLLVLRAVTPIGILFIGFYVTTIDRRFEAQETAYFEITQINKAQTEALHNISKTIVGNMKDIQANINQIQQNGTRLNNHWNQIRQLELDAARRGG